MPRLKSQVHCIFPAISRQHYSPTFLFSPAGCSSGNQHNLRVADVSPEFLLGSGFTVPLRSEKHATVQTPLPSISHGFSHQPYNVCYDYILSISCVCAKGSFGGWIHQAQVQEKWACVLHGKAQDGKVPEHMGRGTWVLPPEQHLRTPGTPPKKKTC